MVSIHVIPNYEFKIPVICYLKKKEKYLPVCLKQGDKYLTETSVTENLKDLLKEKGYVFFLKLPVKIV